MNSGCAAALDRLQDFCFMAIKAANREPCTPPRSTLILTPAFVVYTELEIDPDEAEQVTALSRMYPAFSFDGRTGNGGGLASLTRTVLPVGRCSTGPVIQRIRTWLLGAEKHFWALYVCIWYTGQALSQL